MPIFVSSSITHEYQISFKIFELLHLFSTVMHHSLAINTDLSFLKDEVTALVILKFLFQQCITQLHHSMCTETIFGRSKIKSSANNRRLILHFLIVVLSLVWLHLSIQFCLKLSNLEFSKNLKCLLLLSPNFSWALPLPSNILSLSCVLS